MTTGLSRVFRRGLRARQERLNSRTLAGGDRLLVPPTGPRGFDAESLFYSQYETIRAGLNAHQEQGVLIFAFNAQGVALAQGWLRATLDKTRAAIVGRHTACGLAVPTADRNVSLRHLAVLVRACSHSEAQIRVLDLHTPRGFTDEEGEVLSAATAEGPLFLGLDGLRLAFLVTGEAAPADARAAYSAIPARVLIEERKGTFGVHPRRQHFDLAPVSEIEQTLVRSTEGPVAAVADLCAPDEKAQGELVIRGSQRAVRRAVGGSALDRGILVGRYERCAVGLDAGRLSRVHFLILRDGDRIIGIDTASTNGTWIGERDINLIRLEDGTSVSLARELDLTWHED